MQKLFFYIPYCLPTYKNRQVICALQPHTDIQTVPMFPLATAAQPVLSSSFLKQVETH